MTTEKNKDKKKTIGQVFTPDYMVCNMLDWCGYSGRTILRKHIMDNSCGDGAFLVQAVHRYIRAALDESLSLPVIKRQLEQYIHGMDNDRQAVLTCRLKLEQAAAQYGLQRVKWCIYHMDSLDCNLYDGTMDYVVGNPPYVRIHHMDAASGQRLDGFSFTQKGRVDLYLAFFELGLRCLRTGGQLCYITPVSWLYSKAADSFRDYIRTRRNLVEIIDMGHAQIFTGVTTYTAVSRFVKGEEQSEFTYSQFNPQTSDKENTISLSLEDTHMGGRFYLADKPTLECIRNIMMATENAGIQVHNGFATLADKVFMGPDVPDSPITIPVVKASTGTWTRAVFPYTADGKPLDLADVSCHTEVYSYLERHRQVLMTRNCPQDQWWLYGRTQALSTLGKPKLAVGALVRDVADLKTVIVPQGCGVYNGLYVMADKEELLVHIARALASEDFIRYVRALKIYKSGGYYGFTARDLEQYLHYRFPTETKAK